MLGTGDPVGGGANALRDLFQRETVSCYLCRFTVVELSTLGLV